MRLFRGRRLSFTKKTAGASPSRVTPEHAAALADPVMQTMRAQLFREEALRAPGDKTYEVPMPADAPSPTPTRGAKPFAEQFQKEASKGSRYAAARDAFWGGDDDETDYQEECAKFGGRIGEADRERVAARITETTRFLRGLAEDKAR
ncbi:hypothetical protein SO694_00085171 [Aureococcus anophagefferens]|uniref:Uncharacterized protein n=1 Tax=Aureococcus anophagefferens TaxID=44056 RepID=A0ABR1G4Y4_AURAN